MDGHFLGLAAGGTHITVGFTGEFDPIRLEPAPNLLAVIMPLRP